MTYEEVRELYGSNVAWAYGNYLFYTNHGESEKDPPIDIYFFSNVELVVDYSNGDRAVYYHTRGCVSRFRPKKFLEKDEFARELGRRIDLIIEERNLFQYELAEMTGISNIMINQYIMGKSIPGAYNLKQIADALGCSLDDLIKTPRLL